MPGYAETIFLHMQTVRKIASHVLHKENVLSLQGCSLKGGIIINKGSCAPQPSHAPTVVQLVIDFLSSHLQAT